VQIRAPSGQAVDTGAMNPLPSVPGMNLLESLSEYAILTDYSAPQPVASGSLLFSQAPTGNRAVAIKTADGQIVSAQRSTQGQSSSPYNLGCVILTVFPAPRPSPLRPARSSSSDTLASSTDAQPSRTVKNDVVFSTPSLETSPPTSRDVSPPRPSVLKSTGFEICHDWANIRFTDFPCEKCGHRQGELLWNNERYKMLP
jgi:hypothetical protein